MTKLEVYEALKKPFSFEELEYRLGATNKEKTSGIPYLYVKKNKIIERFNEVLGPYNWWPQYRETKNGFLCTIFMRIEDEIIPVEDGADLTDMSDQNTKGGLTNAFKRTSGMCGIGQYLNEWVNPWVEVEKIGNGARIKKSEHSKIRKIYEEWVIGKEVHVNDEPVATFGDLVKAGVGAGDARTWYQANTEYIALISEAEKSLLKKILGWKKTALEVKSAETAENKESKEAN